MDNTGSHHHHEPPKRLTFDTIKARLLILFLLVAGIPIISLAFFTLNLLEFHLEQVENFTFTSNRQIIENRLNSFQQEKRATFQRVKRTANNQASLCETPYPCFVIKNGKTTPLNSKQSSMAQWKDSLSVVSSISSVGDNIENSGAYIQLDQTVYWLLTSKLKNTDGVFVQAYPLSNRFWKNIYKANPNLEVGLWVIDESRLIGKNPSTGLSSVLSRGSSTFSNLQPQLERSIIATLKSSQHQQQSVTRLKSLPVKISQTILTDLENDPVARLVLILPTSKTSIVLNEYKNGLLYIGFACLVFSLVAGIFTARLITQPLLWLIEEIKAINDTKSLSTRVTATGVDEINQLNIEFNEMLDRLQDEHQQKDTFVATLTHDLKVPLLSEKQSLTYLADGTFGGLSEEQLKLISVLKSTNQSNLDLVNSILEIYRYEAGKAILSKQPVDLRNLLKESCSDLMPLMHEKEIQLSFETTDEITEITESITVNVDPFAIKRTCHNIVSNAISHTHRKGHIRCNILVGAQLEKTEIQRLSSLDQSSLKNTIDLTDQVIVTIEDNGLGFPREYLDELFQAFNAKNNRNPLSTGLGLYHCAQIIEAHGGHIWVETTEGEGSLVAFSVPAI